MNGLMKAVTEKDFAQVFAPLAVQLRWLDADEAAILSYHKALCDIPISVLSRSAMRLANERGRKFFPTTGEWRDVALVIQQEDLRAEFSGQRSWKDECDDCRDTGWQTLECTGLNGGCDRAHEHPAHDYVRVCPCRPTNRTYQRHQWKSRE